MYGGTTLSCKIYVSTIKVAVDMFVVIRDQPVKPGFYLPCLFPCANLSCFLNAGVYVKLSQFKCARCLSSKVDAVI